MYDPLRPCDRVLGLIEILNTKKCLFADMVSRLPRLSKSDVSRGAWHPLGKKGFINFYPNRRGMHGKGFITAQDQEGEIYGPPGQ